MDYKKERWLLSRYDADYPRIMEEFHITEATARVLRNRGLATVDDVRFFLTGGLSDCHAPERMKDMEKGCRLMEESIRRGDKIRIVSDYDADGITSNYILYDGLKNAGADVSYDIPERTLDGYGMNGRIVEVAQGDGIKTLITCDNGIAAYEAVELAKSYGMTVIVTDHHEVKYDLDSEGNKHYRMVCADAVIDAKQEDCPYPYKGLCGAGVAYKFIRCLYRRMGLPWEDETRYMDILAIGTVCDLVPLTDENRIFVREGLKLLNQTKNVGLRMLIRANGLEDKQIISSHLGFRLGPCLNSTGRLESAKEGVALLLEQDEQRAYDMALRMTSLNEERKAMTQEGVEHAVAYVHESYNDNVIVLYLPEIHESVAGLVASRVKDAFYRPTLVFTDAENGDFLKGSGRSIEGYDMFEELSKCSELFLHFGGHPMAAGFSMRKENFDILRQMLNENESLSPETLLEPRRIDGSVPLQSLTVDFVRELMGLEPYGVENPSPLFGLLHMRVLRVNMVGSEGKYAQITFATENGTTIRGFEFEGLKFLDNIKLWFNEEECDKILRGAENHVRLDVLYHPTLNEFRGTVRVEMKPIAYRKSEA